MKSYTTQAVAIYEGILKDAATVWPTLRSTFERDYSCLQRSVEQRGLPFLTIVLPDAGKAFDKALSTGQFISTSYPQGYPLRNKRPKLFGDLFDLIFDDRNMLRLDASIEAIAFMRQLLYCCKKLRLKCDDSKLRSTLDEFFSIEMHLPPSWPHTWDQDNPEWQERRGHPLWGTSTPSSNPSFSGLDCYNYTHFPWDSFRRLCRRIISEFGVPNWWELRPKHGPGVVSEQVGFVSKYEFPHWPRKLERFFPFDWFGHGHLSASCHPSDREPPSRLIAVPKTQKGPRLICAEPLAHQWMQQAIWLYLEEKVKESLLKDTITFRSQDNSRNRALYASLSGDLATIDLSSASDRISTRLVEYVFQGSELLDGFHATRTRMLSQNLSPEHPRMIKLNKFSTMGSACTFPVQSIVFACLSIWALRLVDGTHEHFDGLVESCREVTVFGDDIIIPTRAATCLRLVLHECGLKVNDTKSFSEGFFRESCGMDAFRGYDVTPAYHLDSLDESPSSMATTVEESNNFFKKGYWNASSAVVRQISQSQIKRIAIVGPEDGTFGLFSFVGSSHSHLPVKWDQDLQREYYLALSISSKIYRARGQGRADLTQYFTEDPDQFFNWQAGQVQRITLRKKVMRVYS